MHVEYEGKVKHKQDSQHPESSKTPDKEGRPEEALLKPCCRSKGVEGADP